MELDQAAALRRVAIVLSSLPEAMATRLLGELSSDQQHAVQAAVRGLADIDPLERRRTLDAFAASMRRGQAASARENDAAEIVLSQVAQQHSAAAPGGAPAARPTAPRPAGAAADGPPPLDFLRHVDDDRLAEQVCDEHPQTIAIILASIAPAQAARILPKFTAEIRAETMRRLAKLQPPDPEVIAEISSQLKSKLLVAGAVPNPQSSLRYQGTTAQTPIGQAALRAILAEMPDAADHPLRRDPAVDPGEPSSAAARHAASGSPSSGSLDGNWSSSASSPRAVGPRIAPASTTHLPAAPASPLATNQPSGRAVPPQPASDAATGPSAEAIDAQLIALPPEQLRAALASVPTRQSLLALCGLPRFTADQVLTALPRRQARQIRQQINALGTLELREIDRAKALVAQAARQLDQHGGRGGVTHSRPTTAGGSDLRRGAPPPEFADAA